MFLPIFSPASFRTTPSPAPSRSPPSCNQPTPGLGIAPSQRAASTDHRSIRPDIRNCQSSSPVALLVGPPESPGAHTRRETGGNPSVKRATSGQANGPSHLIAPSYLTISRSSPSDPSADCRRSLSIMIVSAVPQIGAVAQVTPRQSSSVSFPPSLASWPGPNGNLRAEARVNPMDPAPRARVVRGVLRALRGQAHLERAATAR